MVLVVFRGHSFRVGKRYGEYKLCAPSEVNMHLNVIKDTIKRFERATRMTAEVLMLTYDNAYLYRLNEVFEGRHGELRIQSQNSDQLETAKECARWAMFKGNAPLVILTRFDIAFKRDFLLPTDVITATHAHGMYLNDMMFSIPRSMLWDFVGACEKIEARDRSLHMVYKFLSAPVHVIDPRSFDCNPAIEENDLYGLVSRAHAYNKNQ